MDSVVSNTPAFLTETTRTVFTALTAGVICFEIIASSLKVIARHLGD